MEKALRYRRVMGAALFVILTAGCLVGLSSCGDIAVTGGEDGSRATPPSVTENITATDVETAADKCGPFLTELLRAEAEGRAEEYTGTYHFIERTDEGLYWLVVEAGPDRVDAAEEGCRAVAAVWKVYRYYIDVYAPLSAVMELAASPAVDVVRLPHIPTDSDREGWDETVRLRVLSHPCLNSPLNLFALPENEGKAAELAAQHNIELLPGECLRLVVETFPELLEDALQACRTYGTVEAESGGWIQVVLPVSNLLALADAPGVRVVRLPYTPWPASE